MDYVALSWRTIAWCDDVQFMAERAKLLRQGWEVHLQAPWSQEGMPRQLAGGACIMRRPKDEPRKTKGGGMGWDYMALVGEEKQRFYNMLVAQGWRTWIGIPRPTAQVNYVHIMRRPWPEDVSPKDEPRMWTKGEIEEVAKRYYWRRAEGETQGFVLNERAMQADLVGRLERRNAELQAAIDEVVTVCRQDKKKSRDQLTTYAVVRNLYSLATKEEING